jgi:acetylxylan esterase
MRYRSNRRRGRTDVRRKVVTVGLAVVVVVGGSVVAPQAFGGTLTNRFGSGAAANRGGSGGGLGSGRLAGRLGNRGGTGNSGGASGGSANAGACTDVRIIATRASTERPGAGIIGSLVNAVESASNQSISTDTTDYPASLSNYNSSESQGVAALTELVETQAQQCPQQKLVLMGYSQGAHVTGDVLGGGGGRLGGGSEPIGADAADNVAAVILMGDPSFVPGKSFNAGTSKRAGVFPRAEAQSLDTFADKIQSYCDTGDNFCASGGNLSVHLGYTRKYNGQAEAFVLEKIGG